MDVVVVDVHRFRPRRVVFDGLWALKKDASGDHMILAFTDQLPTPFFNQSILSLLMINLFEKLSAICVDRRSNPVTKPTILKFFPETAR